MVAVGLFKIKKKKKKKKKKEEEENKEMKRRREEKNDHFFFSVLAPSQGSSDFTIGTYLSPPVAPISLHHRPLFYIFKLKLLEFFTLSLREDFRIYSKYIMNIILLIYIS
jgi:hypothetical protein